MKKRRLEIYVEPGLHRRLRKTLAQRDIPLSHFGEAALAAFLDNDAEKREAVILRRLDRLTRQYGRFERDLTILAEAFALYIQYELAIKPPIPVSDREAAQAKGRERFGQFTQRLARRLAEGKSLIRNVVEELTPSDADFFSIDIDGDNPPEAANDNA